MLGTFNKVRASKADYCCIFYADFEKTFYEWACDTCKQTQQSKSVTLGNKIWL